MPLVFVRIIAVMIAFSGGIGMIAGTASRAYAQEAFATREEAVTALVNAVRAGDPGEAMTKVLGPEGADIVNSGDEIDDEARRARFLAAYDEAHALQDDGDGKATLVIGKEEYPFPIPVVQKGGQWRWDTASGLDQLLTRRIGENEVSAIEVLRSYVAAQYEYAERPRDGKGIQYARRLMSREGRKDGLYWETAEGETPSPIGPLVAKAQLEGYKVSGKRDGDETGYHGYVYRMLYGQGKNAAEGTRDYIVNDRKIGGFALIATPVAYGVSGVMTFIVNQDGVVYEKDLGPDSRTKAATIRLFDPDSSWRKVQAE